MKLLMVMSIRFAFTTSAIKNIKSFNLHKTNSVDHQSGRLVLCNTNKISTVLCVSSKHDVIPLLGIVIVVRVNISVFQIVLST